MRSSAARRRGVVGRLLLLVSLIAVIGYLFGSAAAWPQIRDSAVPVIAQGGEGVAATARIAAVDAAYGRLPLQFEVNRGQADAAVDFLARGPGYTLFLAPDEAVLRLRPPRADVDRDAASPLVLRQALVGARSDAVAEGVDELPGKVNYFRGDDPAAWRTDVPTYARVRYPAVYPGVDLVYYGSQRELEYDLVVAPGADPGSIVLAFTGVDQLAIDAVGDLVLQIGGREVRQRRPVVYQEIDGRRQEIAGSYVVHDDAAGALPPRAVGFALGPYDPGRPLIIDPVLSYATYLGGISHDVGHSIAADSAGNAYVTGHTCSADFPRQGAFQPAYGGQGAVNKCLRDDGGGDAFVTKLNASGTALIYSTYLGGSDNDAGHSIAVDAAGYAHVAGITDSTNLPAVGTPIQPCAGSNVSTYHDFAAKLTPAGNALVYSVCGAGGTGIALDAAGNAYTGASFEVVKLSPAGAELYRRSVGGFIAGVAIDSAGSAYATGSTNQVQPTVNAAQPTFGGGTCGTPPNTSACFDAFVAKIDPTGSTFLYWTYLGGTGNDIPFGLAVDTLGSAYVTGYTNSPNFPVVNPLQSTMAGGPNDAFVTKISPTGSAFVYSTYLGGSGNPHINGNPNIIDDRGQAIVVDAAGNAYVAGATESPDFRIQSPLQSAKSDLSISDGFLLKLSPTGTALAYSTFVGGSGLSQAIVAGLAVDPAGSAYLTGFAGRGLPVTAGAFQTTCGQGNCAGEGCFVGSCTGADDAFVMKVVDPPTNPADLMVAQSANPNPAVVGQRVIYSLTVTNLGPNTATGVTLVDSLPANLAFVDAYATQGGCTMTATLSCALGTIANGAGVSVTLVGRATAAGTLSNLASVAADQGDPVAANSTSSLAVPIIVAPPANDNFASAQVVSANAHVTANTGGASTEGGEPSPGCAPIGSTVWYSLPPSTTGSVTVSTYGSDFDTVVAVYAGTTLGGLTLVGCSDDAGDIPNSTGRMPQSQVTFTAVGGTTYQVQVGGYQGAAGSLVLDFASVSPSPPASGPVFTRGPLVAQQYGVTINSEALVTNSLSVILSLSAKPGTTQMLVRNSPVLSGSFETFSTSKSVTLTMPGAPNTPTVVYVWFVDGAGKVTGPFADDILFIQAAPTGSASIAARHAANAASVKLSAEASLVPVTEMRLSGQPSFAGASFQPYFTSATVDPAGSDQIYVQFRDAAGNVSNTTVSTSPKLPTLGVGAASAAAGSAVPVNWSDIPNASGTNWIGLFAAGGDDRSWLAERFTDGTQTGGGTFVLPNALMPGNYELRLFAQKGVTRLAASPGLSVTSGGGGTPPTPTATPAGPSCQPRPPIGISTADNGDGRLRVIVTANGAGNSLQSISFTSDAHYTPNALIDAGTAGRQAPFSVEPPANSTTYTFYVRRANPGQAATVPLTVQDGCGAWPTFVGGGPTAWNGAPPPAAPVVTTTPTPASSVSAATPTSTAPVPSPTRAGLPAGLPAPTATPLPEPARR